MRIIASVTFAALLSATSVPALADQIDWGPLATQPRNDQNTIWDAYCIDPSEHVACLDNARLLREAFWGQTAKQQRAHFVQNKSNVQPVLS
jgi:hypothetical protein